MSIVCLHECKRDREGFGNFMHERVRERREEGRKGWGKREGGRERVEDTEETREQ